MPLLSFKLPSCTLCQSIAFKNHPTHDMCFLFTDVLISSGVSLDIFPIVVLWFVLLCIIVKHLSALNSFICLTLLKTKNTWDSTCVFVHMNVRIILIYPKKPFADFKWLGKNIKEFTGSIQKNTAMLTSAT